MRIESLGGDDAEVFSFQHLELALLRFEEKLVLLQALEDSLNNSLVFPPSPWRRLGCHQGR